MCGRYTRRAPPKKVATLFDLIDVPDDPPRYNIAPTQQVLVVRLDEATGKRVGVKMRWGLIPHWAKSKEDIKVPLFNARSETAATKPAFRAAFKQRRCLIPADGFYEWQKKGEAKQPYYIHRADDQTMAFAGLWESWKDEQGNTIESCAILTTSANEAIKPLHDRMPVILEPELWNTWLAGDTLPKTLQDMLTPAPDGILALHPVDKRVNRAGPDDAALIQATDSQASEGGLFENKP